MRRYAVIHFRYASHKAKIAFFIAGKEEINLIGMNFTAENGW